MPMRTKNAGCLCALALFALVGLCAPAQAGGTFPQIISVAPQPFWTTLNLFRAEPKVSLVLLAPAFVTQGQPDYATMNGVDFSGADLRNADFSRANMHSANFTAANLAGAKFAGLKSAYNTAFHKTDLRGATFAGAYLFTATFDGALLENTDFSNARMEKVSLENAVIANANFRGANLVLLENFCRARAFAAQCDEEIRKHGLLINGKANPVVQMRTAAWASPSDGTCRCPCARRR